MEGIIVLMFEFSMKFLSLTGRQVLLEAVYTRKLNRIRFKCPGCWVFGRTPESALRKVRAAVVEWVEWLRRHGERPRIKADEIEVVEGEILRVTYNPVEADKPEPLFWSEVLPIGSKEIERTIRLMRYSRERI